VYFATYQDGGGEIAITDVNGQPASWLKNERGWRVDSTMLEWPVHWGYRHNSRFYVGYRNDSMPGKERWFFDQASGLLVGYDGYSHHALGSFGPDGFEPAGRRPAHRFPGAFRYGTNRYQYMTSENLTFSDGVYSVDFAQRSIRPFFTPASGETVKAVRGWNTERDDNLKLIIVSTDQAFHIVTKMGSPVATLPKVLSSEKYGPIFVGRLENPERYFVWYHLRLWAREPEEYVSEPSHLFEYDGTGRELARREVPPFPYPATSFAQVFFGLITPMTEAATLVETSRYVRGLDRAKGSTQKSMLLDYLEGIEYYIPGTCTMATTISPATQPSRGLITCYIVLILLSATACGLGCFLLARRHAFSRARRIGWAACGFFFGWVGLVLMCVLQEWPAHIACPNCRKLRIVTRDTCEHCGALHATPATDGTEIFESTRAMAAASE
jgi:hypothetical protein